MSARSSFFGADIARTIVLSRARMRSIRHRGDMVTLLRGYIPPWSLSSTTAPIPSANTATDKTVTQTIS